MSPEQALQAARATRTLSGGFKQRQLVCKLI
jgi:hypothetical protein